MKPSHLLSSYIHNKTCLIEFHIYEIWKKFDPLFLSDLFNSPEQEFLDNDDRLKNKGPTQSKLHLTMIYSLICKHLTVFHQHK